MRSVSYRDDLESLGYTLLALLAGAESFWFKSKSEDHRFYIAEKKNFIDSQTIDPRYAVIQKFLREVIKLDFSTLPDYDYFRSMLSDLGSEFRAVQLSIILKIS